MKMYENLGNDFLEYFDAYYKQCDSILDKEQRMNAQYCLEETISSQDFYKAAAGLLKNEKLVYDIGANTNVQRYFFENNGTKFVGIDSYPFPGGKYTEGMIIKRYPFDIENKNACAVSHLCLGFLIQITEENVEYLKQFKTIIFEYPFINEDEIHILEKYFKVSRCLQDVEGGCFKLERIKSIR